MNAALSEPFLVNQDFEAIANYLVEDDANDIALTLRALKINHLKNEVIVARRRS